MRAAGSAHVRRQLLNRPEYRFAEFIQPSPFQTPTKGLTNLTAAHPEVNIILFAGYGILYERELEAYRGIGQNTP